MAAVTSNYMATYEGGILRRISWPAVFGGTLVALATELLFGAFGLFLGFILGSNAWNEAWYFVTSFVALFVGAWVAGKLATNTIGTGRLHGAVTWGLTTMSTFAFMVWMFWNQLSATFSSLRTAAMAGNTAATTQAVGLTGGEASTLFLVIFGGIVAGCVAALIGGTLAGPTPVETRTETATTTNVKAVPPRAAAAS